MIAKYSNFISMPVTKLLQSLNVLCSVLYVTGHIDYRQGEHILSDKVRASFLGYWSWGVAAYDG